MTYRHSQVLLLISHVTLYPKVTQQKVKEFEEELNVFIESFNTDGPGTVGDDLEKGTGALPFLVV